MEDVSRDPQLEKLTSELSWLKRLASALVRDENDANDLVQETWLVAAEHAPTDGRPLKPWLSRVALNVVRMRSRASKRRRARETAVESFAETSPTPDELVSRVEAQRILVDEVLRLAEPYRNTVLLATFRISRAPRSLSAGQHATDVELVVERSTGTIQGTVTGPDGAPISDAWVALHQSFVNQLEALASDDDNAPRRSMTRSDGTGGEVPPVLTDARGHFALTNLLQGKYQVVVEARSGKLRGRAADVTTDAQITIRLASVSSLRGTVHGARGPTDLFSVRVERPTSDAGSLAFPPPDPGPRYTGFFTDGAFTFPRLDPGDYTIDVTSTDGAGKATVHVSSDEAATVDILLVANGTGSGRVVDEAGKPLSGMPVALIPDQPPGQLQIKIHEEPTTSGADGRFQVAGPAGMTTLVILGRAPTAKRGVPVAAGNSIDVGDVTVVEQPQ